MFAALYFLNIYLQNSWTKIFVSVFAGAAVYAICTLLLRADTALMLVETIKKKIKR